MMVESGTLYFVLCNLAGTLLEVNKPKCQLRATLDNETQGIVILREVPMVENCLVGPEAT